MTHGPSNKQLAARTGKRPARQTGWLKTLLATGSIAVTILGTGLIARRDAPQPPAVDAAPAAQSFSLTLEPVPTAAAPTASSGLLNSGARIQTGQTAPSQSLRVFPGALTFSRSSR